MNQLEHLVSNKRTFFNFMNENYTLFQHSNLFLRDLQYAIMSYFEMKENPVNYAQSEMITREFISKLVSENDLTPIDHKSWKVNFEVGIKKIEKEEVENE